MKFIDTRVVGVVVIENDMKFDERGGFGTPYCRREFGRHGIALHVVQTNTSSNRLKGTLRGLHYQAEPHGQPKLVSCTRGAIFDVAVDLRKESESYRQWFGTELSAGNNRALYIPAGCAHGFVTLDDDVDVFYMMGAYYEANSGTGVRWDDSAFGIAWPLQPRCIAPRDSAYPDFAA